MSQVAAASSSLTRAADAALVAERVQQFSEVVSMAGVTDVEEGVDMLMKGGDVRTMGAIVSLMSKEELERGLELARLAVSCRPSAIWWICWRCRCWLNSWPIAAAPARHRGRSTAALHGYTRAGRSDQGAGRDIEAMGETEIAEGQLRVAVAQVAAERSPEFSAASDALAGKAVDELTTAAMAGEVAREAVVTRCG